jgi:hypothetical protein
MAAVDTTKTTDASQSTGTGPGAGPQAQTGTTGARPADRAAADNAARNRDIEQKRRAENERERSMRANRPQGVGGNPTPTQEENDKIRAGEMHIDDKADDGSGPDPADRAFTAGNQTRGYETR